MSWNHRVIRRKVELPNGESELIFGVHEVYYDKHGKPTALTAEDVAPMGETLEELQDELIMFVEATSKPVLNYEDF